MTIYNSAIESNTINDTISNEGKFGAISVVESSFRDENPVQVFKFDIDDKVSLDAGRLHARVYSSEDNAYIGSDDLDENGMLSIEVDPYRDVSDYFYISTEDVSVVSRQISVPRKQEVDFLPTIKEFSCDSGVLIETAHVESIGDLDTSRVVEISGLAAEGQSTHWSVVRVYSEMMRKSLEDGHNLWIMSTDSRLTPMLDYILLGNLKVLGDSKEYMGSLSDPRCLNPQDVLRSYIDLPASVLESDSFLSQTRDIFLKSLQGLNVDNLDKDLVEALNSIGVATNSSAEVKKFFSKNKASFIAGVALTGYAAARAVPLATVDEFNGSPAIFAALDIGTIPPYIAGLSMLYGKARSVITKATGGVMASASFMAPYAYMYAEGDDYPGYVNGIVGALVIGGIAKEIYSRKQNNDRIRKLQSRFSSSDSVD